MIVKSCKCSWERREPWGSAAGIFLTPSVLKKPLPFAVITDPKHHSGGHTCKLSVNSRSLFYYFSFPFSSSLVQLMFPFRFMKVDSSFVNIDYINPRTFSFYLKRTVMLHQHWLKETWGIFFHKFLGLTAFLFLLFGTMLSASFFPSSWRALSGRITFKQWTLSSNTKEKGQSRGCSQSHSCGQGESRDERMPVGFAMESEWTKKLSQAFSLHGRPAAVAPFYFFPFLSAANLLKRIEDEEETCFKKEELRWKQATRARCYPLQVFIPSEFKLFLGHQRINWKRNMCYATAFMRFLLH